MSDAREQVLAMIEQSRITQAKRDGWDAGFFQAMFGGGGKAFGEFPCEITVTWPDGPPPHELLAFLQAKAGHRP